MPRSASSALKSYVLTHALIVAVCLIPAALLQIPHHSGDLQSEAEGFMALMYPVALITWVLSVGVLVACVWDGNWFYLATTDVMLSLLHFIMYVPLL